MSAYGNPDSQDAAAKERTTNSVRRKQVRAGVGLRLVVALALPVVVALSACGSGASSSAGASNSAPSSPVESPSDAPIVRLPSLPAPVPVTTSPAPTATAAPKSVVPPSAPDLLVNHLVGVGNARQVISVTTSGYGTNVATLEAFTKTAAGWTRTFGPWTAHIGRKGFAPPGQKREGDLRTPSGAYGFSYFFGIKGNPGVQYPYRVVGSSAIVWDDDPASANYNLWIDTGTGTSAGASPEPMYNAPVYYYGAVIAYNAARTPGLGSAIFLHQNSTSNGSTAGCVSLPASELLAVLRWLAPSSSPVIVMGTTAAVTH
jgi:L,D-peptidoglycan transpeptidase YkuD (ErfK/YbiS/YcfS/YnhG family)